MIAFLFILAFVALFVLAEVQHRMHLRMDRHADRLQALERKGPPPT